MGTNLYTKISSVHVVSEEEVPCGGWGTAHFEKFDQVEELSVNVTAHSDGRFHIDHVLLLTQQIGALFDDAQCDALFDASLEKKMLTQLIEVGLSRLWIVVYLRHG